MLTRKTEEPQTTDRYVSELTRKLRRHLPRDKANEIAGETCAHLSDRVHDLTGKGVARHEAESVAVAGFGSVRTYAHDAVLHAYGDRRATHWRRLGQAAAVGFVVFAGISVNLPWTQAKPVGIYLLMSGVFVACGLLVLVSAFGSRLPQTRALLAAVGITVLCGSVVTGLWYVPNTGTPSVIVVGFEGSYSPLLNGPGLPRANYDQLIAARQRGARVLYRETSLLKHGVLVYREGRPVPPDLMYQGRYIVPNHHHTTFVAGAFKEDTRYNAPTTSPANYEAKYDALPYFTAATRQEAAQVWREFGPRWLNLKQREVGYHQSGIATLRRAATAPLGFNTGAATGFASGMAWHSLPLIAFDYLLAHLGRALWIASRNYRNRDRGRTA